MTPAVVIGLGPNNLEIRTVEFGKPIVGWDLN